MDNGGEYMFLEKDKNAETASEENTETISTKIQSEELNPKDDQVEQAQDEMSPTNKDVIHEELAEEPGAQVKETEETPSEDASFLLAEEKKEVATSKKTTKIKKPAPAKVKNAKVPKPVKPKKETKPIVISEEEIAFQKEKEEKIRRLKRIKRIKRRQFFTNIKNKMNMWLDKYMLRKYNKTFADINVTEVREKLRSKRTWIEWFNNLFGFEEGIDILDQDAVLFRKNCVIKRIIFIANLFLIAIITFTVNVNFIVSLAILIPSILVNGYLKRTIYDEPRNPIRQQVAMYLASSYIFLLSIGIYIKLKLDATAAVEAANAIIGTSGYTDALLKSEVYGSIANAGYIVIFFAIAIIGLYQSRKLMSTMFKWIFAGVILINLTVLHPVYLYVTDIGDFFRFFWSEAFRDIVIRLIILLMFMLVIYATASIAESISKNRLEELVKRQRLEIEFARVVGNVFNVINVFNESNQNETIESVYCKAEMVREFSKMMKIDDDKIDDLYDFSVIHIKNRNKLTFDEYKNKRNLEDSDYTDIQFRTNIGLKLVRRLEIVQVAEDAIRAHFEKWENMSVIEKYKSPNFTQEEQMILIIDFYDALRSNRSYKSTSKHKQSVDLISRMYFDYFNPAILEMFKRHSDEFSEIYLKYNKVEEEIK